METATKVLSADLAASQPLSKGEFLGSILVDPPEGDSDGERIPLDYIFKGQAEIVLPLDYQHALPGRIRDPLATVGTVTLRPDPPYSIKVHGKLNLGNPMADAVYQRLLADENDPTALREMSVEYGWSYATKDANGVSVVMDPQFARVALVYVGAQMNAITAVKAAAVDNSKFSGSAAMASCSSAADFRSVCAGERNVGEPDERQHWALPHHMSPGAAPNADGVRNALSRLPQTEGLTNRDAAQSHLEAHMSAINPDAAKVGPIDAAKVGRPISKANESKRRAHIAAMRALADEEEEWLDSLTKVSEAPKEEAKAEKVESPNAELREKYAAFLAVESQADGQPAGRSGDGRAA